MRNRAYLVSLILLTSLAVSGQTAKFSAYTETYNPQGVGTTLSKSVTLTNSSATTQLLISSLTASPTPPFSLSGTCTSVAALAPKAVCTLNIIFAPTTVGSFTGAVTLVSNDSVNKTQTIKLSGTAANLTLAPTSIAYGNLTVGLTSTRGVTLKNIGLAAIPISSVTATNTPPFTQTNNCGTSLGPGIQCIISVTFRPAVVGPVSGTLSVVDGEGTQTTSLSGTGLRELRSITVTPANLSIVAPASQQYTATGNYSDGTHQNLTSSVVWTSSTAAASITAAGLATGKAAGTTSISAKSGNVAGATGLTVTVPAFALTVNVTGTGSGTVSGSPAGINCPSTCSANYSSGAQVTLTPAPATGSTFAGWSGACSGTGSCQVTVSQAQSVTATFNIIQYALTVTEAGTGSGTVSGSGINCPSTCSANYNTGTQVTLTPAPATGSTFSGWSGACSGTGSCQVPLTQAQSVTATFNIIQYALTLTETGAGSGTVSSSPVGINCPTLCSAAFDTGTQVTLTPVPATGSTFAGWSGACSGTGSCQVPMTQAQLVTAAYNVAPPVQTGIVVSPNAGAINTGDSQQFTVAATYSDGTTGPVTSPVTWSSTVSGIAVIDTNGLAVGDAGGSATINAVSGTFTASASLTVNGANACTINNRIDMKLLVLSNAQTEASFPAIITTLKYLHTPYDVFDTSTGTVSQAQLYNGCHAFYSGVIVAFLDGSAYNPAAIPPTLPFQGYDVLQMFEQTFGIRQLNWYAFPSPSLGFNWSTGSQAGDTGTFTNAAATVFPYLAATTLVIDPNAFVYLSSPLSGVPLLSDANGNALSLDDPLGDGREYLSNTFASNQYMLHNIAISYGLVNWVTKGLFVGEKHIFFTPQEDDWGIEDDIWTQNDGTYGTTAVAPPPVGSYPVCGTSTDKTGMTYRITASDADAFVLRQNAWQANPLFTNVNLFNAFNGCGLGPTDANCGLNGSPYPNDTLTTWTSNTTNSAHFGWINHTFEHLNVNRNAVAVNSSQLSLNLNQAATLGFAKFSGANLVTPDISGLNDANALQAMVNNGIQFVVSDTSCTPEKFSGQPTLPCNQSPNNGPGPGFNLPIVDSIQPSITVVPRRPNNLFYNVGDPNGWDNEYQCIYQNQPPYSSYTTQNILDFISADLVSNMMLGDADPEMFHQTNLRSYNGTNSLLSDLVENTFSLYQTYFNLPVKSMSLDQLGRFMLNNQAVDASGIVATTNNGSSRTVTLAVTNGATIPVTGLGNAVSASTEQYGTQFISHVSLTGGKILTQPAP